MRKMAKLNELDLKILELLEEDSRQSYREMAKKLNVSHVNVSNRIQSMEQEGIIRGYTTITNPDRLDYYALCLRISADPGADLSGIGRKIAENDSVDVVLRVSGECELLALAVCGSRDAAIQLLDEINDIPGIQKAESHVVLEAIKLGGVKIKQ